MASMKRLVLALFMLAPFAYANGNLNGFCDQGNIKPVVSGLTATNTFLGSYPRCTVTVTIHGGGVATIFSDNSGTPLANPFTASSVGWWQFYAANGRYDVTLSGGTPIALPSSWTIFDQVIFDSTVAGCLGTSLCQGGNSFGTTLTFGTNDPNNINMRINGTTRAAYTPSVVTFTADQTGGQTLKLDNTHGTSGASTSVNFYKNGVYVGMVGDRGTSSQISLQHSSGAEIILGSGVVSISGPGGGVLTSGGGLTAGGTPGAGSDGISGGSYAIGASTIIDSSQNISVSGFISSSSFLHGAYLRTINTGTLTTPPAGELSWGSVVIAGVTTPVVKDSLGNQTVLGSGSGGSGTVTSVSTGSLSPLFTASIATPTTTPALSFALSNGAAYSFYGNNTNASAAPAFNTISAVVTKTSSYTVASTDYMKLISVSNGGAQTLTLPGTVPAAGWQVSAQNTGAGTWTIDPNGHNLDGAAGTTSIVTNAGMIIRSDGSNYFTFRGNASSGSGCASVDPSACILKGSAANSGLNNDAANIAFGLLSAHDVIGAANSAEVIRLRSSGDLLVGLSSSDVSGTSGQVIAGSVYGLVSATTNASTGGFGISPGSYVYINSSHTGSGANLPIVIQPGGSEKIRFPTSGPILVNATSALGSTYTMEIRATGSGATANSYGLGIDMAAGSTASQLVLSQNASGGVMSMTNTSTGTTFLDQSGAPSFTIQAGATAKLLLQASGSSGVVSTSTFTVVHNASTTTFTSNAGVVFPSFAFGSLPTSSDGMTICTSCKNVDQDGIVAGSQCQTGSHIAIAFFNGNHNVCF